MKLIINDFVWPNESLPDRFQRVKNELIDSDLHATSGVSNILEFDKQSII